MFTQEIRSIALAVTLVLAAFVGTVAQAAADWPFVYGPATFVKTESGPQQFSASFLAGVAPHATYRIVVRNGDTTGDNPVTSGSVTLNGSEVVSEADFNAMVTDFAVEVDLETENDLVVELKGAPGSTMRLAVVGRELEDGFMWGGIISSPWVAVSGGPLAGIDAVLHVKSLAAEGPIAVVVAFFNEDGRQVFHTRPMLFKNHGSEGFNLEYMLLHYAEQSEIDPAEIFDGIVTGSLEIYWVAATPSRTQASYTWAAEDGRQIALGVPFNLIAAGRIPCRRCDVQSGEAGRETASFSGDQIRDMVINLRDRELR